MMKKNLILLFSILLLFSCSISQNDIQYFNESNPDTKNLDWTLMFYLGGDNNLEYDLIRNIRDIKESYQGGCNVIVFIDRSRYYSMNESVFGEDFYGPRIYRVLKNKKITLLQNSDFFKDVTSDYFNSANLFILRKFIDFCKKEYPARYYGLIIGSHGGGTRGRGISTYHKNVVYDESNDSWIWTKDWKYILTEDNTIDILGFDACFMGNLEFLYEIKDRVKYVVASPPTEWSYGWNYKGIFGRISENNSGIIDSTPHPVTGKNREVFPSSLLTPFDLGRIIIEEHYNWTYIETDDQVLSLYDTEKIGELKNSIDNIFVLLKENSTDIGEIRGTNFIEQANSLLYFDSSYEEEWIDYCYFDIYDFMDRIIISEKFSSEINNIANNIKNICDHIIIYSFGGEYFKRFKNNKTGLSFFMPDGTRIYNSTLMWAYQNWYNAKNHLSGGNLSFCKDGAIENNGIVENYFEVLDYWFDIEDGNGGYNLYSY